MMTCFAPYLGLGTVPVNAHINPRKYRDQSPHFILEEGTVHRSSDGEAVTLAHSSDDGNSGSVCKS